MASLDDDELEAAAQPKLRIKLHGSTVSVNRASAAMRSSFLSAWLESPDHGDEFDIRSSEGLAALDDDILKWAAEYINRGSLPFQPPGFPTVEWYGPRIRAASLFGLCGRPTADPETDRLLLTDRRMLKRLADKLLDPQYTVPLPVLYQAFFADDPTAVIKAHHSPPKAAAALSEGEHKQQAPPPADDGGAAASDERKYLHKEPAEQEALEPAPPSLYNVRRGVLELTEYLNGHREQLDNSINGKDDDKKSDDEEEGADGDGGDEEDNTGGGGGGSAAAPASPAAVDGAIGMLPVPVPLPVPMLDEAAQEDWVLFM